MEPNIINRIEAKKREFANNNKQSPTKLYLTISDELDLSALPATEIGDLAGLFIKYRPKEALKRKGNKFCGLEVVLDSDVFKVE
ncbi:MAG: hypothetical protein SCARUB_05235 [Candidatus Scalindua rubra]|uniref:Uncharacterized protein n=1 Tax=Candidatus Scalindua rubra TaxID=1872076 RepID=A0A1E3X216_9BACT|nr:MAG: hypothetical protein SCARUB_05235 [Candidatus Scalindua rubra]